MVEVRKGPLSPAAHEAVQRQDSLYVDPPWPVSMPDGLDPETMAPGASADSPGVLTQKNKIPAEPTLTFYIASIQDMHKIDAKCAEGWIVQHMAQYRNWLIVHCHKLI